MYRMKYDRTLCTVVAVSSYISSHWVWSYRYVYVSSFTEQSIRHNTWDLQNISTNSTTVPCVLLLQYHRTYLLCRTHLSELCSIRMACSFFFFLGRFLHHYPPRDHHHYYHLPVGCLVSYPLVSWTSSVGCLSGLLTWVLYTRIMVPSSRCHRILVLGMWRETGLCAWG
jgi:hypothetical protein